MRLCQRRSRNREFHEFRELADKTIRRINDGEPNPIMPMYKDEEDSEFGDQLFATAISQQELNEATINHYIDTRNWDVERIALLDKAIMLVALAEVRSFEKIPTTVTLNEYIEIAKLYSAGSSPAFINGVLNAAIRDMKNQKVIMKP
jgi:N utilization substance protein B